MDTIKEDYQDNGDGKKYYQSEKSSYEFPVADGDLGAALHEVGYTYSVYPNRLTQSLWCKVTITDTYDFTKFKNPFTQGSLKANILWFANDVAYFHTKAGGLKDVEVTIIIVFPLEP